MRWDLPEWSGREKSEAKVSGVGEEEREQIMQPGAAVAALDIWEGQKRGGERGGQRKEER